MIARDPPRRAGRRGRASGAHRQPKSTRRCPTRARAPRPRRYVAPRTRAHRLRRRHRPERAPAPFADRSAEPPRHSVELGASILQGIYQHCSESRGFVRIATRVAKGDRRRPGAHARSARVRRLGGRDGGVRRISPRSSPRYERARTYSLAIRAGSRRSCDRIARRLTRRGVKVLDWHAPNERHLPLTGGPKNPRHVTRVRAACLVTPPFVELDEVLRCGSQETVHPIRSRGLPCGFSPTLRALVDRDGVVLRGDRDGPTQPTRVLYRKRSLPKEE